MNKFIVTEQMRAKNQHLMSPLWKITQNDFGSTRIQIIKKRTQTHTTKTVILKRVNGVWKLIQKTNERNEKRQHLAEQ